jgi:hypothetical protein
MLTCLRQRPPCCCPLGERMHMNHSDCSKGPGRLARCARSFGELDRSSRLMCRGTTPLRQPRRRQPRSLSAPPQSASKKSGRRINNREMKEWQRKGRGIQSDESSLTSSSTDQPTDTFIAQTGKWKSGLSCLGNENEPFRRHPRSMQVANKSCTCSSQGGRESNTVCIISAAAVSLLSFPQPSSSRGVHAYTWVCMPQE